MIPSDMFFDQLTRFGKCLTDNSDGTFTLETSVGSASGSNCSCNKIRTTYDVFDKAIVANKVRTF